MQTRPVYITGGIRTPFVKSQTKDGTTQALMTATLEALTKKMGLQGKIWDILLLQELATLTKNFIGK